MTNRLVLKQVLLLGAKDKERPCVRPITLRNTGLHRFLDGWRKASKTKALNYLQSSPELSVTGKHGANGESGAELQYLPPS